METDAASFETLIQFIPGNRTGYPMPKSSVMPVFAAIYPAFTRL